MNTRLIIRCLLTALALFSMTSCRRGSNEVWEDTKTASRHMHRGIRSLGGKHGDSRAIRRREDFMPVETCSMFPPQQDFVPLADYQNPQGLTAHEYAAQPTQTPGEYGSNIPGIDAFRDPNTMPQLSGVFRPIRFEYNSNLIKGDQNLDTLHRAASYMKQHPGTYLFVEGHCDERGPEAYNLALGSRRANAVRSALIAAGVNSENVFTISYGKERPLIMESHEEAWTQNRRAEFKIYQR